MAGCRNSRIFAAKKKKKKEEERKENSLSVITLSYRIKQILAKLNFEDITDKN